MDAWFLIGLEILEPLKSTEGMVAQMEDVKARFYSAGSSVQGPPGCENAQCVFHILHAGFFVSHYPIHVWWCILYPVLAPAALGLQQCGAKVPRITIRRPGCASLGPHQVAMTHLQISQFPSLSPTQHNSLTLYPKTSGSTQQIAWFAKQFVQTILTLDECVRSSHRPESDAKA